MALQIRYIKNPIKKYTFLLLATSILGVHFLSIDVGIFQLSIYRILIILSPIFYIFINTDTKDRIRKSPNYLYFQLLLFWVIYSLITLIWIRDLNAWIRIFSFLLCGCISSWFIGWYFSEKKDWINALKVIEFCALVFGSLGVYEIITGHYLIFVPGQTTAYETSASSSTLGIRIPVSIFGNSNNFALFMLLAIFGSIALLKVKSSRVGRLFSLILTLYFFSLLVASQSRSGFLAFILGLIPLTYMYLENCSFGKRLLITIVSPFILFTIYFWIDMNYEIFESLITFDISSGSDRVRLNLIKNGMIFLINSLFMGVGLGNIEYYMVTNPQYNTFGITNIHNWWLEILVSSGIFIFIMYMIIYFKTIQKLYQLSIIKSDKVIMNISKCFFCFLIAFLVGATGASTLMTSEWLWPIMALIMSFVNTGSKSIS